MGGCCCCPTKSTELNGSPTFLHYPASEDLEPLSSHHATTSTHSGGLLVDTNLDTSVPDTYRPPPAPIPYETYVGPPLAPSMNRESTATKSDSIGEVTNSESTKVKNVECDENGDISILKGAEDEKSDDLKKFVEPMVLEDEKEEEDVCPTCLEEYEEENPRIVTKCEHHFHLACILEWMERSGTCPVCDKEMVFSLPT